MKGMPRSLWSVAGEALITVVMLIGVPLLVSRLGWPLRDDASWPWLWQYLRGGALPAEVVLAVFAALLWAAWVAYLIVIFLDILALLRGLVPRVGLVRLVWVLTSGGAAAASTHTAAMAAHVDTAVEVPARPISEGQDEDRGQEEDGVIERTRTLSGFGFDSADLTSGMQDSLEPGLSIEDFHLTDAPVVVTGHTDPVGDPGYNQGLSEQRAQAAADYLAEHLEEEVEFEVSGVGSAQPPADTGASYAEHRRVEIAYTLQAPGIEEPNTEEKAENEGKAVEETSEPGPEQVQLDVSNASDHDQPSPLLVGAVAGAAGVGVGYAAGRRHAHTRGTRPAAKTPESGAAPGQCEDSSAETDDGIDPSGDELVRGDLRGAENGIIDPDGYMLVGQTVRVDARQGVAFTGAHAAEVLAAAASGHERKGPVLATRTVVEALGGSDMPISGAQVVADLPGVRIAVETALLTRQRQHMDDELETEQASEPGTPCSLVVYTATEAHDALEAHQMLRNTLGVVVGVLGELEGLGAVVHCDDLGQGRVTSPESGQTGAVGPLRHRARPRDHGGPDEAGNDVPEPVDPRTEPGPEFAPEPEPAPEAEAVSEQEPVIQPAPVSVEIGSTPPPAPVRVQLFAPQPVCEVDGREVLTRTSSRLLLAMLALSPRGLSESQIDEVLAYGKDETKARKNRYNAITGLRARLKEALDSDDEILFKKNGRYVLQEDLFGIDVWHTNELRQRVNLAGEDRETLLRELVRFWEKPLLPDCGKEWFEIHRKHYIDQLVEVLVLLAKTTNSVELRVSCLKKAMGLDRFNESIYQDTMCVYGGMGRTDAVQRTYRALETALGELKKKPSPMSERLLGELARPEVQA
ncbi:OmpA family protein [Nocardiopsis alba]|uniref:OmpA family protein n=1 Tax=Nocardiopsis alba TaxID=53437 RepID=UPI0033F221F6